MHIGIDRSAEALQLDIARHLDVSPFRHIVAYLEKILGACRRIFNGTELPCAVEAAVIGRLHIPEENNIPLVGIGYHVGVRRHLADAAYMNVVPVLLSRDSMHRTAQQTKYQAYSNIMYAYH